MSDGDSFYVWHWIPYTSGGEPRYVMVRVLAWEGAFAIAIELEENGFGWSPKTGATPHQVPIKDLRLGYPPDAATIVAA